MPRNKMIKEEEKRIYALLAEAKPDSDEYKTLLTHAEKLSTMKTSTLSLDNPVVVTALAQSVGLLLVLNFEKIHILTSRSIPFLPSIRR